MNKAEEMKQRKRMQESHSLLTNKQKEEIKKAFDYFDVSGSGPLIRNHRRIQSQSRAMRPGLRAEQRRHPPTHQKPRRGRRPRGQRHQDRLPEIPPDHHAQNLRERNR